MKGLNFDKENTVEIGCEMLEDPEHVSHVLLKKIYAVYLCPKGNKKQKKFCFNLYIPDDRIEDILNAGKILYERKTKHSDDGTFFMVEPVKIGLLNCWEES